ncbi:winged helix-turn-helix domain-containing protein [Hafnia paralvei]|uniref:winged helix-turn-helix domain-containing protein n=1 Tax=Hafnia paralvei TaxID=546367 RepID=UPI001034BDE4|nr:winged helix-turn-helix domain-containing protein [Hafnia paralvei]TBL62231.1 ArsR family transcriptional regulator [Hafnia paralvei]
MDFTKRLITQRLNYFCKLPFDEYFETSSTTPDEYFELIFKVSMNVPRIIGYILFYCHQTHISIGRKINKNAIESAAENYYNKVVSKFFDIATHSLMSFSEKVSELQQKEILNLFVLKLKNVKRQISSGEFSGVIYNKDRSNPFCSHFYFQQNLEHFVRTLELNFFITKYNEMVNKDGIKVSIYGLNYGLCKSENLRWGKPEGTQHRTYFIERPFDFNKDIEDFLKESKRIVCLNSSCGKTYPYEDLKFLEYNKMTCIECHSPVEVKAFSESISSEILKIDNAKLLPKLELTILHELHKSGEEMLARDIAEELDVSSQIIAKRSEKMDRKGLVSRDKTGTLIKYSITEKAIDGYFYDS